MVFSAHHLRSCVRKHRLQALQFQFLEFSGAKMANANPTAFHRPFTTALAIHLCVCVLGLHGHWWEKTLDAQGDIYLPTWLKTQNIKKHFLDMEVKQHHLPVCRTMHALPKVGEQTLCTGVTSLPVLVLLLLKQKCWMMVPENPAFKPPFFCKQRMIGTHSAPECPF